MENYRYAWNVIILVGGRSIEEMVWSDTSVGAERRMRRAYPGADLIVAVPA